MDGKTADGFWRILSYLEATKSQDIMKDLNIIETAVTNCYECCLEAPTLPHLEEKNDAIKIAALFLKRCLSDFRALWNLLTIGYSTQAGTIAAALFENALIINCVEVQSKGVEIVSGSEYSFC